MALADLLYGGDRNMVVVNMSEYKESHKVSRLVGTSMGYVGYGVGGVITTAVNNRPYSVVLLDEVEKADESVQEIFYQVFDKGSLQNDDGEEINFKNTIILLTSNVGTDTIMKSCADPDTAPAPEGLGRDDEGRPAQSVQARCCPGPHDGGSVLPARRRGAEEDHPVETEPDPRPLEAELQGGVHLFRGGGGHGRARCKDVDSGARNADHIITGTVLTMISAEVLTRLAEGKPVTKVSVGADDKSQFVVTVE